MTQFGFLQFDGNSVQRLLPLRVKRAFHYSQISWPRTRCSARVPLNADQSPRSHWPFFCMSSLNDTTASLYMSIEVVSPIVGLIWCCAPNVGALEHLTSSRFRTLAVNCSFVSLQISSQPEGSIADRERADKAEVVLAIIVVVALAWSAKD